MIQDLVAWAQPIAQLAMDRLTSSTTYAQAGVVAAALLIAWAISGVFHARAQKLYARLQDDGFLQLGGASARGVRTVLSLALAAALLGVAKAVSDDVIGASWLARIAQGLSLIFLIYALIRQVINDVLIGLILKWICVPIAIFYIFGLLDYIIKYLDSVSIQSGNINISLYVALRAILFGTVLFWLGRASSATGQRVIRNRAAIGVGAREVIAKLFEIGVYSLTLLLLLNVVGIDLTALAVFGGALAVGVGVGLQPIASNFISGLIILLDRSITIGDYIELEDGRKGVLRNMTIRSATLETFDGKDIMVPNEKFITTTFVNWTHNNQKQRYSLNFQVAYDTDLPRLFDIVREVVASHPMVMSGEDLPLAERPDAEIEKFGDSGIDILVEYWMEAIDDGENRVGADLLLMIWTALKANGIEIPFPQREVRLLK